ncbi:MAG: hypothetical protein PHV42_04335 [Candidatus Pacebacteria bacterium]|nr:hypothetical protein [Candidatus Paceibacterota bacterium]
MLDEKTDEKKHAAIEITDPENNKFRFSYDPEAILCGIEKNGLTNQYLKSIGIDKNITGTKAEYDMVSAGETDFRRRDNDFDRLRVYLVRYYPKQRDAIHRFFKDLERHYLNYISQQQNMLLNNNYTLTSLMIEWGDYSLEDLLMKYFSDPEIIKEFMFNQQLNGLDPKDVNSYHFFSQYFLGLKEGFYYINLSTEEIKKLLLEKLRIINPKITQKRRIKEFVYDEAGKITHVVDSTNKKIYAKHFIVSSNPDEFYKKYFPSYEEEIELVNKYYPNLYSTKRINTLYLALNQKPQQNGITELNYFFAGNTDSGSRIVRLFNYGLFDPDSCSGKNGAICVDFVFDDTQAAKEEEILQELYRYFPKLKKTVVGVKEGIPREHLSMVSLDEVRKGLSINEQIEIEASEHLMFFDNLHITGRWVRPEACLFGCFHTGIVLGDKVEESLYYGEDDDSFYYLTNDEIMMMMRHNYGRKTLGKIEQHINFHIGKSSYFVRTKDKNITIHHGEYPHPDLTIYTTNDKLSNLLLKKTSLDEVLKANGLKYTGSTELLYQIVSAFDLDDYKEEQETRFQPKLAIKNLGIKLLFIYLSVFSLVAFLHNFINLIWLAPFAFGISLALSFLKMRIFRKLSWFEYAWNVIYFVLLLMAIFWPAFNSWKSDDLLLGLMGGMFFIAWLINRPIVYDFHKYDYRIDYSNTALFKVMNNGLTFVWALIFLSILVGTYITGERYVSVLYNLVFVGFFMTYYYPIMYVRANIKK